MPFTFPNVTLYKDDVYRVCHSPEEFAALSPKGWAEEAEAGVTYRPLSATWKPAPRPALVAALEPVAPLVIVEPEQVKAQVTKK